MKSVIFGYKHQFELDLSCETNPSDARQREEKKNPNVDFWGKEVASFFPKAQSQTRFRRSFAYITQATPPAG